MSERAVAVLETIPPQTKSRDIWTGHRQSTGLPVALPGIPDKSQVLDGVGVLVLTSLLRNDESAVFQAGVHCRSEHWLGPTIQIAGVEDVTGRLQCERQCGEVCERTKAVPQRTANRILAVTEPLASAQSGCQILRQREKTGIDFDLFSCH